MCIPHACVQCMHACMPACMYSHVQVPKQSKHMQAHGMEAHMHAHKVLRMNAAAHTVSYNGNHGGAQLACSPRPCLRTLGRKYGYMTTNMGVSENRGP